MTSNCGGGCVPHTSIASYCELERGDTARRLRAEPLGQRIKRRPLTRDANGIARGPRWSRARAEWGRHRRIGKEPLERVRLELTGSDARRLDRIRDEAAMHLSPRCGDHRHDRQHH